MFILGMICRSNTERYLEGYGHPWIDYLPCQEPFAGNYLFSPVACPSCMELYNPLN